MAGDCATPIVRRRTPQFLAPHSNRSLASALSSPSATRESASATDCRRLSVARGEPSAATRSASATRVKTAREPCSATRRATSELSPQPRCRRRELNKDMKKTTYARGISFFSIFFCSTHTHWSSTSNGRKRKVARTRFDLTNRRR